MLEEVPFKILKNGRSLFEDLEMNLLSASQFLGRMSRLLTRYSRNLLDFTSKVPLSELMEFCTEVIH